MAPEYLLRLGTYTFALATAAAQQWQHSTAWRWQAQNRAGQLPAQQYLGPGEETITLEGIIYPHFKGGLGQLDAMREQAGLGRPLLLTDGQGRVFQLWVIKGIAETRKVLFADGTPRRMEFSLQLTRYGEETDALSLL